jgi:hypothetical protein
MRKNERAYNVCQNLVRNSARGRSMVTVVFGVALRGRPEPCGQHKGIHQQELISLRFRDRERMQSGRLSKWDMPTRQEDVTVTF